MIERLRFLPAVLTALVGGAIALLDLEALVRVARTPAEYPEGALTRIGVRLGSLAAGLLVSVWLQWWWLRAPRLVTALAAIGLAGLTVSLALAVSLMIGLDSLSIYGAWN